MSLETEDVLVLANDIKELLHGEGVNTCVSALLTALVEILTTVSESKAEVLEAVTKIHWLVTPASVAAIWQAKQTINH